MGETDPRPTVPAGDIEEQYRAESGDAPPTEFDLRTVGAEIVPLPDVIPPAPVVGSNPEVRHRYRDMSALSKIADWLDLRR